MKRIKLHLSACLLLAGSAAFVSSCQDYEPFSEERVQDVAYTREFERQFGEIDPNQNWDLFGQLANGVVPVTRASVQEFVYDWSTEKLTIDEDKRDAFKQVLPESNAGGNTYDKTNLGQVTQNFTTTARSFKFAPVYWQTSGHDEIGIYWYVGGDEGGEAIIGRDGKMYFVKRQMLMSANEFMSHLYYGNGSPNANPAYGDMSLGNWTADYFVVSSIPSEISSYGFYITNHDYDNRGTPKTKYSEANLNRDVANLKYVDSNGQTAYRDPCYVATFNLKELGFANQPDQRYICFEDWMGEDAWGNCNFDLNDAVFGIDLAPNTIIDHDAVNEQAILVCEDLNQYDFDFNDVVLGLTYREEFDYQWVEDTNSDGNPYKKKTKIEGSDKRSLFVTAMAAGGAFESTVKFKTTTGDELEFGKIHPLMGETSEESGYGKATGHNPLNSKFNATANYSKDGKVYSFVESYFGNYNPENENNTPSTEIRNTAVADGGPVIHAGIKLLPNKDDVGTGENYTYATYLSKLFATGFIRIYCTQGQDVENGVSATKLLSNRSEVDSYYDTDEYPRTSQTLAPQMMLLPWYFEWPQEEEYINDAYTGFSDWVSDVTKTNWITSTQNKSLIVERGDFITNYEEDTPVDPGTLVVTKTLTPQHERTYTYDAATTYNNAVYIPLPDVLINEGAIATLRVTYLYRPSGTLYINDGNLKQLFKDNSGANNNGASNFGKNYDDMWADLDANSNKYEPITLTYSLTSSMLERALTSGGIWMSMHGDLAFQVKDPVVLAITGAADENKVQNLYVDPTSITFNSLTAGGVQIRATSTTLSNNSLITYTSSDTNVAEVSSTGLVTPKGEGKATITVTAPAEGERAAYSKKVQVVVDMTHNLTVSEESLIFYSSTETQSFTVNSTTTADASAITVSVSDVTIATVAAGENAGEYVVRPLKDGNTTITVTAPASGGYKQKVKTVDVTVAFLPDGFTVNDAIGGSSYNAGNGTTTYEYHISNHAELSSAEKIKIAIKITGESAGTELTIKWANSYTKPITIVEGQDIYEFETTDVENLLNNDGLVISGVKNGTIQFAGVKDMSRPSVTLTPDTENKVEIGEQWGYKIYRVNVPITNVDILRNCTKVNVEIQKSTSQNNTITVYKADGTTQITQWDNNINTQTSVTIENFDLKAYMDAGNTKFVITYIGWEDISAVKLINNE